MMKEFLIEEAAFSRSAHHCVTASAIEMVRKHSPDWSSFDELVAFLSPGFYQEGS